MNLRSIGTRTVAAVGALGAVAGLTAAVAGAQTAPGRGPFASGMLTSVSGSTLQLQRTNPQDQSQTTDVSVTLTGSTGYQKVQQAASDAIAAGACVRVAGKGSVDKGKITASTVNITSSSSGTCTRPGGGNGTPPGAQAGGTGNGGSIPNGSNPPNGSFPRNGRNRPRASGVAFGSVQSVKGNDVVMKATVFQRRSRGGGSQTSAPKSKTKKVTVTLSSSTAVTQVVAASQADLATGECVSAAGTGDPEAITADRVTISQPENGSCRGFGFGGGGGGGPGAVT
jgi:hypothetical protein